MITIRHHRTGRGERNKRDKFLHNLSLSKRRPTTQGYSLQRYCQLPALHSSEGTLTEWPANTLKARGHSEASPVLQCPAFRPRPVHWLSSGSPAQARSFFPLATVGAIFTRRHYSLSEQGRSSADTKWLNKTCQDRRRRRHRRRHHHHRRRRRHHHHHHRRRRHHHHHRRRRRRHHHRRHCRCHHHHHHCCRRRLHHHHRRRRRHHHHHHHHRRRRHHHHHHHHRRRRRRKGP